MKKVFGDRVSFRVGDVVKLNSGSPRMTVTELEDPGPEIPVVGGHIHEPSVWVCFFDRGQSCLVLRFPVDALKPAPVLPTKGEDGRFKGRGRDRSKLTAARLKRLRQLRSR